MTRQIDEILTGFRNGEYWDGDHPRHLRELAAAKLALKQLLLERMPKERSGKHHGHQEDDGYCYNCQEIVKDPEELRSFGDWAYNACIKDMTQAIEALFGEEGK